MGRRNKVLVTVTVGICFLRARSHDRRCLGGDRVSLGTRVEKISVSHANWRPGDKSSKSRGRKNQNGGQKSRFGGNRDRGVGGGGGTGGHVPPNIFKIIKN